MKIVVRKNCFETNSSSNHSLIITNEENMEKDKETFLKEEEDEFFAPYGNFCKPLKTKEEKCYFMADLFHKENKDGGLMDKEYKVFIKVLKDNKEKEILENIKNNKKIYKQSNYDEPPFCQEQFYHGCLIDCYCPFYAKFKKYFGLESSNKSLEELMNEIETKGIKQMKKEEKLKPFNEEELYKRLYDFIYKDGVIVPYEGV